MTEVNGSDLHSSSGTSEWQVGQFCVAPFSGDGNLYEALVTRLDDERHCSVVFLGYNNVEDDIDLQDLLPSRGENARARQNSIAKHELESEFVPSVHPEPTASEQKSASRRASAKSETKWRIGNYCQNLCPDYDTFNPCQSQIIGKKGDTFLVRYVGYKREEYIDEKKLYPSSGRHARNLQRRAALWEVGQFCVAPFSGENVYYEACIIEFLNERHCTVEFLGYDIVEDLIDVNKLLPSRGEGARAQQVAIAKQPLQEDNITDSYLIDGFQHIGLCEKKKYVWQEFDPYDELDSDSSSDPIRECLRYYESQNQKK